MKILLTHYLVISIVSVYTEAAPKSSETNKSFAKFFHCAAQYKVNPTSLIDYVDVDWEFPNKPEVQCFLACLMKEGGMMNDDGTVTEKFSNVENYELCKSQGGKDACEIAFKTLQCLSKHNPRAALMIAG